MTILSEPFLSALCRMLVGTLLFAQAAFATQPCVAPGMSAASAVASKADDAFRAASTSEASLCVMKCTDTANLSAHTPLVVPPAPTGVILILSSLPDNTLAATASRCLIDPSQDPPKTIRFCSFLL